MGEDVGTAGIEAGFPSLFVAADRHAIVWQRRYLRLERLQLWSLVLAAVTSTIQGQGWRITAFVLVLIGFGAQLLRVILRADQKWWNGRALAETVKTTSWKYCVGGDPLPVGREDGDAAFARRLERISQQFQKYAAIAYETDQISPSMRHWRSRPLDERVSAYRSERIQDQAAWYSSKARINRRTSRFWTTVAVALQVLAVVIGALTISDTSPVWDRLEFEQVGVLTSAIAAVVAWMAVKQHDSIEQAYRNAALELDVIDREFPKESADEDIWARFVDRSEQAISREHTSWLASQSPARVPNIGAVDGDS